MVRAVSVFFFVVGICSIVTAVVVLVARRPAESATLFLLIDGFRSDYADYNECSSLRALFQNKQTYVPVFPSRSAPNYWSLVTGKLPGEHGIVGNHFFDSGVNETFSQSSTKRGHWFHNADPIWTLTRKRTSVLRWYGAEERHPALGRGLDEDEASTSRRVADVLRHVEAGYSFIVSAISIEVDAAGHRYGPESDETRVSLASTCNAVASLVRKVRRDRPGSTFYIVGDHGMAEITNNTALPPLPEGTRVYDRPAATVWAVPGRETETRLALETMPNYYVVSSSNASYLGDFAQRRGGTFVLVPKSSADHFSKFSSGGDHGCNASSPGCSNMKAAYLGPPIRSKSGNTTTELGPIDVFEAVLGEL